MSAATFGEFTRVINVPPDALSVLPGTGTPGEFQQFTVPGRTQVNITAPVEGAGVPVLAFDVQGELNYSVPLASVDVGFTAQNGGTVNLIDGFAIGLDANQSGTVRMFGGLAPFAGAFNGGLFVLESGEVGTLTVASAEAVIRGGIVTGGVIVGGEDSPTGDAVLNLEGGSTNRAFLSVGDRGIVNLSADFSTEGNYSASIESGGLLNLIGSNFRINGVPISGLSADEPIEVMRREVILTGLLRDGSEFLMNISESFEDDSTVQIAPGARLTLTLQVPEARAVALCCTVSFVGIARSRNRG